MDINHPFTTIERSTEMVWSSEDQSSGHPKSYTCSFCKRGFSNAQALGGHMNIHRRDRARLKEYSDEALVSTKKINDELPLVQVESSEEKSSSSKRPWMSTFSEDEAVSSSRGRDGGGGLRQLPLFEETPRTTHDSEESSGGGGGHGHGHGHVEKGMQCLSHGNSSQTELDLELRLGLEPHEASTGNTKEYFF